MWGILIKYVLYFSEREISNGRKCEQNPNSKSNVLLCRVVATVYTVGGGLPLIAM
jgi:hypothetical protein